MKRLLSTNTLQCIIFAFVMLWAAMGHSQTAHKAIWTINTNMCNTASPGCTAQIWRVALPNGSTCPANGDPAYINVAPAIPGTFVDATQTTWKYTDTGPSLVTGAMYCGYATYTNAAGVVSPTSATFHQTIQAPLTAPGINVQLQ